MQKPAQSAGFFHNPEINGTFLQNFHIYFVTSYNLNIYTLFYFTISVYYNIKRFKLFHFSSPLYLVAESAGGAADFCYLCKNPRNIRSGGH